MVVSSTPQSYHDGRRQPYVRHGRATLAEYRDDLYCTRYAGRQPGPGTSANANPEPETT
jgi:hypothetical protein